MLNIETGRAIKIYKELASEANISAVCNADEGRLLIVGDEFGKVDGYSVLNGRKVGSYS